MLKPFQFSMLLSDFEASNIKIKGSVIIEDYEWTCDVSSDPIQTKLITLQPSKPGRQSASFIAMYGGEHEEGYSHTQVSVIEGDEFWEFSQESSSSDCDGRLDHSYEAISDGSTYRESDPDYHAGFPNRSRLHDERGSQRDYSAEAMGY